MSDSIPFLPSINPDAKNPLAKGAASLLMKDDVFREQVRKASAQVSAESMNGLTWVPQPISFEGLAGFHHPVHDSCLDIKTNMTVGLGLTEGDGDQDADLPGNATGETFHDVLMQAGKDAKTTGNGYIEEVYGGKEYYWLPAHTMEMSKDRRFPLYRQVVGGKAQVFRAYHNQRDRQLNRVIHVRYPSIWSTYYGGPSWLGGIRHLLLSESALRWNQAFFENHCIPRGILYVTGVELDKKIEHGVNEGLTVRDLLGRFLRDHYGNADNAHRVMLMSGMRLSTGDDGKGAGIRFERLTEPVKDGDFLKLMDYCDTRIAILPPDTARADLHADCWQPGQFQWHRAAGHLLQHDHCRPGSGSGTPR